MFGPYRLVYSRFERTFSAADYSGQLEPLVRRRRLPLPLLLLAFFESCTEGESRSRRQWKSSAAGPLRFSTAQGPRKGRDAGEVATLKAGLGRAGPAEAALDSQAEVGARAGALLLSGRPECRPWRKQAAGYGPARRQRAAGRHDVEDSRGGSNGCSGAGAAEWSLLADSGD
uniref:Uncharacterized protein n=1 Tax=Sphaerodactylus townsendi TaxID=933632 RepID=A0ACB8GCF0_9SAUR